MNILIIGSNGFIGQHCLHYFSNTNNKVYACDLNNELELPNFISLSKSENPFEKCFENNTYDCCINASGMANVALSEKEPLKDYTANVQNTLYLLELIRTKNPTCKFVHLSSAAVYGNPKSLPVKESDEKKPISVYGFHKLQSELICLEYAQQFKIKTLNLRLFSVFGEGLKKQLFWDLHNKLKQDTKELELFGKPNDTRDFIHISDLMQVLELILEKVEFNGQSINVSSGIESDIKSVVESYMANFPIKKKINFSNSNLPGYPSQWRADVSMLKEIGFMPKISLEKGLQKYYKWAKDLK